MLKIHQTAPDLTLPLYGGGSLHFYDLHGISVLSFYKFSCPVCQFMFPFLQNIYEAYGNAFSFIAIAQDPADKTKEFREDYGITIPTAMDLPPYPVSNSYRIHTVPSVFLIDHDRKITSCFEGFVKREILNLADVLAEKSGRQQIDVFEDASVPEIRPG